MGIGELISDRCEANRVVLVGGHATVFRGKDIETGEKVAIKLVLAHLMGILLP